MPGDISQLTTLGQTMSRIGDQHVGVDGDRRIAPGSSNWFGRAVNWIKSAFGRDDMGSKAVMNKVVGAIRDTEGMGDRFAEIAKGRLGSALTRGTPITGRRVAEVISDLVRVRQGEISARNETIKLNVRDLCEQLCDTGDTPLMKALEEKMDLFGLGDRFGELGYQDVLDIREKVQARLERSALSKGQSPTVEDAKAAIEEGCRVLALNMVKESISEKVSSLGDHSGPDSALTKAVKERAGQRGMTVDVKPELLGKLTAKFEDKLTATCLYDRDNMHPPKPGEAEALRDKVVNAYLDALAVVDSDPNLSGDQKRVLKEVIASSTDLYTPGMAEALCRSVDGSQKFIETLQGSGTGMEALRQALSEYNAVMDDAVYQEASDKVTLLRDGIAGGPEAEAVRQDSIKAALLLTGLVGDKAGKAFGDLTAQDGVMHRLRTDLNARQGQGRELSMQRMTLTRVLDQIGRSGDLDLDAIDEAMRLPEPKPEPEPAVQPVAEQKERRTIVTDPKRMHLTPTEIKAREEGIKLNVRDLCERLCDTGDTPLMKALEEKMDLFGLGGRFGELSYQDVMDIKEQVRASLERSALSKGQSPTVEDAKAAIEEGCRMFALGMVRESIDGSVSTLGDHSGPDSALAKAVKARAGQRGMTVDVKPEDLGKLTAKFEDKLTKTCLYDPENMHPPKPGEAEGVRDKIIDAFLDALAVVDADTNLSGDQKQAVKEAISSATVFYTPQMAEALCKSVEGAQKFTGLLLDPQTSLENLGKALDEYNAILDNVMFQEISEKGSTLLREGIGGGPEADAVRNSSAQVALKLAGLEGDKVKTAFHDLIAPGGVMARLRFDIEAQDDLGRQASMKKMTTMRFLDLVGTLAGVDQKDLDKVVSAPGPGSVSTGHLRFSLGPGVHGQGGVVIGQGFDTDKALQTFNTGINEDFAKPLDGAQFLGAGAPTSLLGKAAHFSQGFLGDFCRRGIVVDGERITPPGEQDFEAMEKALDKLIAKFPSVEEAGRVTKFLFQNLGATTMVALLGDPATAAQMNLTNTTPSEKTSDILAFSITSRGNGNYGIGMDLGWQKSGRTDDGERVDPLSLCARLDIDTIGMDRDDPAPVLRAMGFDFVFGKQTS